MLVAFSALLHAHYVPKFKHDHDEILRKLTRYCGKSVYNYTEGETDRLNWDFYNSFYFAYTVVSTIGTYSCCTRYMCMCTRFVWNKVRKKDCETKKQVLTYIRKRFRMRDTLRTYVICCIIKL